MAGAYRLGPTTELLPRFGVPGLYSSTLFHLTPELFACIGPALEMGRSFVRPEYRKQYAPLLLLWKGVTRYVSAHPECAVLFGAVSISNDYNPVSRSLLAGYLETQKETDLARFVKPRHPIARASAPSLARIDPPKPRAVSRRAWKNSPRPSPTWSATARACRSRSSNI